MHTPPRTPRTLCLALLVPLTALADNVAQTLPFTQNWSNAGVLITNNTWGATAPGLQGFRGDGLVAGSGTDPQLVTADGTTTPLNVTVNQTAPNTLTTGGIAEFAISNPVVAMQGSGTANAPFLLLHLDTTGFQDVTVAYLLRDIDGSSDNSIQPVALQYRVGSSGAFTNLPAAFVADASSGPNTATQTNAVSQLLPASAANQALVQVRFLMTDAAGSDEWIGVDDISVTGTRLLRGTGLATPSTVPAGASAVLTVTVPVEASSTGVSVRADLSSIGGSATQAFVDNGTGGDVTAGDQIFTFTAMTTPSTTAGLKLLPVTLTDAQSRTASTTINLTVDVSTSPYGVVTFNPATVNVGAQTLLTVAVTPATVPTSTGLTVVANLTALGGSATQALLDDGLNGDAMPGDNVFSFRVNVALAQSPGAKVISALISDAQARTATSSGTLTVRTPTNPSAVSAANPSSAVAGTQRLLTVTVTAGSNPTSTGVAVAADLTAIGGAAIQSLFDDGTHGDVTLGDGVYSFLAPIPGATTVGAKSIPVAITDAQLRTASSNISLQVTLGTGPAALGAASPSSLLAGASTLLTVTVTPGISPASTGLSVTVDLSSIGRSATASFLDDGNGGDVSAGDNVFSLQTTVAAATSQGGKTLAVSVSDAQARTATASIALTVLVPTSPTGVGLATPASVVSGSQTLLTVAVTAGTNPSSTGLAVSANLTSLGGSATQAFVDDGTGGDATAGDNRFSFNALVPAATTPGARTLAATITDAQSRTGGANISLTVTAPPTSPAAVAMANPSMLPAGGTVLVTVAVTPGTNPTSTTLAVRGDLTSIGGSSTQAFLDNGLLGDVTAGDNIFTFRAVVAAGTSVGAKSFAVSVGDAQSRAASATASLTVTPASVSPMATGTATPGSVTPNTMVLLAVAVTPGANPPSTDLAATLDLRAIGGSAAVTLRDDGLDGDATSGDNIFSARATVTASTTPGAKSLPVAVTDAQSRSAATMVALTVLTGPTSPTGIASANPSTLMAGGTTLLTVTVAPATTPPSTGITVTGNMIGLGGAAAQTLRDDGTEGDVTASDNVFSFSATLPAIIAPGARSVAFTVADAQARAATVSVQLVVSAAMASCGNSVLESGEQCDDGNTDTGDCCSASCAFESADTVCRASGGSCDVAENCTGNSARCPGDVKSTGVCRVAAGVCDLDERCDGMRVDCPVDVFSLQPCRAASGECDVAERCDGFGVTCPADASAPEGLVCGADQVCKAGLCTAEMPGGGNTGGGCTCAGGPGSTSGAAALALMLLAVLTRRTRRASKESTPATRSDE